MQRRFLHTTMMTNILFRLVSLSTSGLAREKIHLSRYLQYSELARATRDLEIGLGPIASISGSQRLCHEIGFHDNQIIRLNYPEFNITSLPFEDNYFSVCVADQVLEHVESDPSCAFREIYRILKPGGYFINATVMSYPIHYGPCDLWRFTPQGHQFLFESNSFVEVFSGTWGGRLALLFVSLGLGMINVPKAEWHPVKRLAENRGAQWPVVIWSIGQKMI